MRMVLMSGCGVSTLFPVGNMAATEYWLARFIAKGVIPEIQILNEEDLV